MGRKLDKLTIRGFKSIESLVDFELGDLNVLIGANGSGKSNFVDFFRLLRAMVDQNLQAFVTKRGPSDGYFYNGVSYTKKIQADMYFGSNRYAFSLEPTAESKLMVAEEQTQFFPKAALRTISSGELEAQIKIRKDDEGLTAKRSPNWYVWDAVSSWQVYHFHDTSMSAGMRREVGVEQSEVLASDASNLAAFLLELRAKHPNNYEVLRKTIRRVTPYFDDFELRVTDDFIEDRVRLTWKQLGKEYVFSPGHLSDGTIRFICLATVLTQPNPPKTIVLDEPELGLHPEALSILGGLLRSASSRMQIIIATQSPVLLSEFESDQIITADQIDGATKFARLDNSELSAWIDDYSLGDLWQKGTILGGVNDA